VDIEVILGAAEAEASGSRELARRFRVRKRAASAWTSARPRLCTAIARHTRAGHAALAICAITAAVVRDRTDTQAPPPLAPGQPPAEPGMIPLTVPEITRLLAARFNRSRPPGRADSWQDWRRRHQARSRWFHQRTWLDRENAQVS